MSGDEHAEIIVVARHKAGTADEARLNALIQEAWAQVLAQPKKRTEIASLLGVSADTLNPDTPPLRAEMREAGITGGEVLILFLAAAAGGFVKDMGSAAGKAAARKLRKLWNEYLRDQVSSPRTKAIGQEMGADDDDED